MASFDSIIIGEDWISEHFFTTDSRKESFNKEVRNARKEWKDDSFDIPPFSTFESGLGELLDKVATTDRTDRNAARELNAIVRKALGYPPQLPETVGYRADIEITAPNSAFAPNGEVLLLEAYPLNTIEDFFDENTGQLLDPIVVDGEEVANTTKALSELYRMNEPPQFIVVFAGSWVVITEAERWTEGRYLAINLQLVAERKDSKVAGEMEHAYACLRQEAFFPSYADGEIWWNRVLEESRKHTVGVSEDLRRGIRESVEIIANDVVQRRTATGLDNHTLDANELAKQSLRFLYRILFILFAEASPELEVLPTGAPEYDEGYGLDRLRELTLVELTSPNSKNGTHIYQSLALLFKLVDQGHTPAHQADELDNPGLEFNSLRADLFSPDATALIDEVQLGNQAAQRVLQNLLLTDPNSKNQDRGFISYAELGINQLGSVYEGLMSYSGFLAEEDLYEVAPGGDATHGSWVVPVTQAESIDEKDFVTKTDPTTGETKPVLHPKGAFVYRLSNRERQRSASYYSPEVLTRFVVSQSLAELLDQNDTHTSADEILNFTVCEPALGSGAFAIEAVRQLANEYLKRKQEELGKIIPAEEYPVELQKVKAHIALHQVYGVDLNATAVELAEISLWLDTMFSGLQAPWFGLHLRRGNSLLGARHEVYNKKSLKSKNWTKYPGIATAITEPVQEGQVYHFLLPRADWAAVVDHKEAKALAKEECAELRKWRNSMLRNPSAKNLKRLHNLSKRVDILWHHTLLRLQIAEREIHRDIDIWGQPKTTHTTSISREQVEETLGNPDSAYQRLRLVMDTWMAFSFWPTTADSSILPTFEEWIDFLESALGNSGSKRNKDEDQIDLFTATDWNALNEFEELDHTFSGALSREQLNEKYPWLLVTQKLAQREGFFHWELDFASVFDKGGFDLQIGNPPWVRPFWDEGGTLAELDAWWQLNKRAPVAQKNKRKAELLEDDENFSYYMGEVASNAGLVAATKAPADYPLLSKLQADLYRCFMTKTWHNAAPTGAIGLIHPDSHFNEKRATGLRNATYKRLRRHFHFINELKLFEVHNETSFGVHIYGAPQSPNFIQLTHLYHPETAERSFKHDGTGPLPGIKDPDGNWDLRPHKKRITHVDLDTLKVWASLTEDENTPPNEARMLYLVTDEIEHVADKLSHNRRLRDIDYQWTRGWDETGGKKEGYFHRESIVPNSLDELIILGPHFTINQPFFKSSNPTMKSNKDYTELNLEELPENFIPRTNYALSISKDEADKFYPKWIDPNTKEGVPSTNFYSLVWREMVGPSAFRTFQSAILAPGIRHPHSVITAIFSSQKILTLTAGIWSSICIDFIFKIASASHANDAFIKLLPVVTKHRLQAEMILRVLRLNSLTAAYKDLWDDLFDPTWLNDGWVPEITTNRRNRSPIGEVEPNWNMATPLRIDQDRRQAQVEIDAIAAIMLGLDADDLEAIYLTQFPVLKQNYEDKTVFDPHGRQLEWEDAKPYINDGEPLPEGYATVDRVRDMRLAYNHFMNILKEREAGDH